MKLTRINSRRFVESDATARVVTDYRFDLPQGGSYEFVATRHLGLPHYAGPEAPARFWGSPDYREPVFFESSRPVRIWR